MKRALPTSGDVNLPLHQLEAHVRPETFDEDNLTVEVQFLTPDAEIIRYPWFDDPFMLSFDTSEGACRTERLESGKMPALFDHWRSTGSQAGVVTGGRVDASGGFATVRLSRREDVAGKIQDIKDGVLCNVSMGVHLWAMRDISEKDDKIRRLVAIDWEVVELSFVTVPAVHGANTLSDQTSPNQDDAAVPALVTCHIEGPTHPGKPRTESMTTKTNATDPGAPTNFEGATPAPATPTPATPTKAELDAARLEGAKAERERVSAIERLAKAATGDHTALAAELIRDGVTLEDAREKILLAAEALENQAPTSSASRSATLQVGTEEGTKVVLGLQNALDVRAGVKDEKGQRIEHDELGAAFRGMTLMELGAECLRLQGVKLTGTKSERAFALLRSRSGREWNQRMATRRGLETELAMHSTSDFPLLLANTANKTLLGSYQEGRQTFRSWAQRGVLTDFKPHSRIRLGEAADLILTPEGAEIQTGTMGESQETITLATYTRGFSATREMMVNDDLSAFLRVPRAFGQAASRLESDVVYAQVTANPNMSDGNAVFSGAHGNLTTALGSLNVAALTALREKARAQKGLGGGTTTSFLNVELDILLVPEGLETEAEQLVIAINADTVGNVNPFQRSMKAVEVEPRLGASAQDVFYMMSSMGETLEYAYLQGEEGPQMRSREGFHVQGMEYVVSLDFAAAWTEHRYVQRGDLS